MSTESEQPNLKTIGKFQVQRMLGRGATATVYLAQDPFTNKEVAIKVAHPEIFEDQGDDARFMKMFINEASLAGKLRHPNIVSVFDAGNEGELHYIVMEYVAGHTLKQNCHPSRLLPASEVVEIIFKCCNALEYAFFHGLIHRDLKPANLLVTSGTNVKITDFGTALLTNSELTQVVDAVGTPSYMSPEQLMGGKLSQQADIYSLGVVMYQLLSGRLPFSADNQYELIKKIAKDPPAPLAELRPELPEAVVRIIDRCLQKKSSDRYPDWAEMAHDLSAVSEQLEHAPVVDDSDTRKFNLLKRLDFFREFTDVELWELLRISKWRTFKGAKTLIEEGKIGSSIFILASGEAKILKNNALLGILEAGQCFGEMAYIHGTQKPRTASVMSINNATVIKIRTEDLQQASDQLQTRFNKMLLRTLAERLERTSAMASGL